MMNIYESLKGSPIRGQISPAMRKVFDNMVTRSERVPQIAEALKARVQPELPPKIAKEDLSNYYKATKAAKAMGIDTSLMTNRAEVIKAIEAKRAEAKAIDAQSRAEIPTPFDREAFLASKPIQQGVESGVAQMIAEGKSPDQIYAKMEADGFARAQDIVRQLERSAKTANAAQTSGGRSMINDIKQIRSALDMPGLLTDAAVNAEAQRRIDAQGADAIAKELITKPLFDAYDNATAIKAIDALNENMITETGLNKDAYVIAHQLTNKLLEAKGAQARALRTGRDILPPAQRNKADFLEALRIKPDKIRFKNASEIALEQAAQTEKVLAQLKKDGIDPTKWGDEQWGDNEVVKELYQKTAQATSGPQSKLMEWYYFSLLSGSATVPRNIAGNELHMFKKYVLDETVRATVNLFFQAPGASKFRDLAPILNALYNPLNRWKYLQTFMRSWKSGEAIVSKKYGSESETVEQPERYGAIGGFKGTVVRKLSKDLMQATDEASKHMIMDFSVGIEARKAADKLGLKANSPEYAEFINQEINDANSVSSRKAYEGARDALYQGDLGETGKALVTLRNSNMLLRMLFPFVKTPINILKKGMGTINPYGGVRELIEGMRESDQVKLVNGIANLIVSIGAMYGIYSVKDNISGAAPLRYRDEKNKEGVMPAYSVRVGDKLLNYRFLEPLATAMALGRDSLTAIEAGGDTEEAIKKITFAFGAQIKDKAFLKTIGQMATMFDRPDNFMNWMVDTGATFTNPALFRQIERASTPYMMETGVIGKGSEAIGESVKAKMLPNIMGIGKDKLRPKVNIWGEDRRTSYDDPENMTTLGKSADFFTRLLSPMGVKKQSDFAGEQLIYNWNKQTEGTDKNPYNPDDMDKYFEFKGTKYYYNREEWYKVQKVAGLIAKSKLEDKISERADSGDPVNIANPSEKDIMLVKKILTDSRAIARNEIMKDRGLIQR
jgi:hypothetical protein